MKHLAILAKLVSFAAVLVFSNPVLADDNHTPIGDGVNDLPLFDAHIHYKQPAWEAYPVESVIELMNNNGVAMALVSSTPDEGTIRLWEYAPNRIVPELRPYHGNAGSTNWTKAQGMEEYLKGRLEKYPHEGIGEFHIHSLDPSDWKLLKAITQMAKERNILLHVHSGADPIKLLYKLEPSSKIIWAHLGLSTPVDTVYETMKTFPDLHADTSYRESDILDSNGHIDPKWKQIVIEFQDRLMMGTDTWVNSQWDNYSGLIAENRLWLSKFPKMIAEKIAYKNAEKLFGRKVSMKQIGTR